MDIFIAFGIVLFALLFFVMSLPISEEILRTDSDPTHRQQD